MCVEKKMCFVLRGDGGGRRGEEREGGKEDGREGRMEGGREGKERGRGGEK